MIKIRVIILFAVYLKTDEIVAFSRSADVDIFHQTNDKILEILDDLFIVLKISKNFTKSKNAEEYNHRHNLVENVLCRNHKRYKQIRDVTQTKNSNKIAYYISNINEVIDDMIRSEIVTNSENNRNDTSTRTLEYENLKEFVKLARWFNLKLKTIAATVNVPELSSSKTSQEEGRRIFEGSSTGIARYPFMASVHVAGRFTCAGSLLHESLVLSAASCLMRAGKDQIQIRVASDYVSKRGSLVKIAETIFHPQFDRTSLANNLVLLRTRQALRFRKQRVVAIQYDRSGASILTPRVEDLVILGWGKRRMDGIDLPEKDRPLSEGHIQLYDFGACQYIYTRDFVSDKCFCAGFIDRGAGACNHDAGGPALVNNMLVGVISFGSPHCGATEAPTVFTRIGLYADWIDGVFRKVAQVQRFKPEDHWHIEENPLRIPLKEDFSDLDQALKEVYKENLNVDEVLYGPIDRQYDDDITNASIRPLLPDFPSDPSLFPNPELVAFIPQPKTPKPYEPPLGYWRDWSKEDDTAANNNKLPVDYFSQAHPIDEMTDASDPRDIYADNDETPTPKPITIATEFYDNEIEKISRQDGSKKWYNKMSKSSLLREIASDSEKIPYKPFTRLLNFPLENTETLKPHNQKAAKIETAEENHKAVILVIDSGTTQMIKVDKKDPIYKKVHELLAVKIPRT